MAVSDSELVKAQKEYAPSALDRNDFIPFDQLVGPDTLAEIPNPYRVIEDKSELINIPLFVREVVFKMPEESDYDSPYVILYCATPREQVIVTDGGTGIYPYMRNAVDKRLAEGTASPFENFYFPNGLRVSEYPTDENGKPIPKGSTIKPKGKGATFYFA